MFQNSKQFQSDYTKAQIIAWNEGKEILEVLNKDFGWIITRNKLTIEK